MIVNRFCRTVIMRSRHFSLPKISQKAPHWVVKEIIFYPLHPSYQPSGDSPFESGMKASALYQPMLKGMHVKIAKHDSLLMSNQTFYTINKRFYTQQICCLVVPCPVKLAWKM